MLRLALLFVVIAIIAAVLGFGGVAGLTADIALLLFFGFLVLAAAAFIFGRR